MTGEEFTRPRLSPRQLQLVDMFVQIGEAHEAVTPGQVHAMDQATAFMRSGFAKHGAGVDTLEDYFYVVAGLNVGTIFVAGILERKEPGVTAEHAISALRASLDLLAPEGARRFDEPQDPTQAAWYDQSSAFVRDFLKETMQQNISDPKVFDQIAAGMTVGAEWMQGLLSEGYPPGQASYMTCVACALIAPEGRIPSGDS